MSLTLGPETIPLRLDEHGTIRVGKTRVTLESIAYCFEEGDSPEAVAEAFPTVPLADLYLIRGYCLKHPQEVEEYLATQRRIVRELRQQDESGSNQVGLRAHLLGRKEAQDSGK